MKPLTLLVLAALIAVLHKALDLVLTNEYAVWAPALARLLTRAAGFVCRQKRGQWWADLLYVQRVENESGLVRAGSCFLSAPVLALRHAIARFRLPRRQLVGPSGGLLGPARLADEQIGLNGRIAAAVTGRVGSMWTVYATLAIVGGWIALATWGPLHRLDPYPFPFMLFLGNVVQLLLCFVIVVGQRVLGRAADRRALQTYESAEAIFQSVARLREHLDRHDRVLSQGISLMESSPHPWVPQHRVEDPPQATDYAVGVNGRIAAWMTRRIGSMWAFYAAAVFQLTWIGLAEAGVLRFDLYPFPFLLFVSSLIMLILLVVIMVGQGVLGQAADRRSEQTFLNAQAILYECQRMEAHLAVQDQVIERLSGHKETDEPV